MEGGTFSITYHVEENFLIFLQKIFFSKKHEKFFFIYFRIKKKLKKGKKMSNWVKK